MKVGIPEEGSSEVEVITVGASRAARPEQGLGLEAEPVAVSPVAAARPQVGAKPGAAANWVVSPGTQAEAAVKQGYWVPWARPARALFLSRASRSGLQFSSRSLSW